MLIKLERNYRIQIQFSFFSVDTKIDLAWILEALLEHVLLLVNRHIGKLPGSHGGGSSDGDPGTGGGTRNGDIDLDGVGDAGEEPDAVSGATELDYGYQWRNDSSRI